MRFGGLEILVVLIIWLLAIIIPVIIPAGLNPPSSPPPNEPPNVPNDSAAVFITSACLSKACAPMKADSVFSRCALCASSLWIRRVSSMFSDVIRCVSFRFWIFTSDCAITVSEAMSLVTRFSS